MMRLLTLITALVLPLMAVEGTYDHAVSLYQHTDYAGAISALGHPSDARSFELLGKAWFMQAEYKKSTEALEKAAALDPASSDIQLWLGRAYGRRAETSFALSAMGYAGRTREAFEKAVHLDAMNKDAVNDLFDFYLAAPGMVGGGLDKARALLPMIAKCDPEQIHTANAQIDEQQKHFDSAEVHLRKAVETTPYKVGHIINLARFLAQHGRFEESEKTFEQAERVAPDAPRLIFARAETYVKSQRNIPEARQLLKKYIGATNLTPEDPPRSEALKLLRKIEGS